MSVVISGGGLVGSVLALILSKLTKNLDISVIEQNPPHNTSECFLQTPKVIVVSRGAYSALLSIDVSMESILSNFSSVVSSIDISENNQFNKVLIKAQDYQLSELGYVLDLNNFKKRLFNLLHKQPTITIYYSSTIKHISREKSQTVVFLSNGKRLVSKLIIVADGSCSYVASYCGIKWTYHNYQQIAVVTQLNTDISCNDCAFEKFTMNGSLAILPMSNNISFLIWCIPNWMHKEVIKWNKKKFSQELQDIFGWRLGKILNVGDRYYYNLCLAYAKRRFTHRLVLVGNAAQKLHPIAGQGFNLGLRDAIVLSKIIKMAISDNIDFGSYVLLNLYQEKRRVDQYQSIMITDGLMRVFNSSAVPLIIARNIGLLCFSYSSFLKNYLVNKFLSWRVD